MRKAAISGHINALPPHNVPGGRSVRVFICANPDGKSQPRSLPLRSTDTLLKALKLHTIAPTFQTSFRGPGRLLEGCFVLLKGSTIGVVRLVCSSNED